MSLGIDGDVQMTNGINGNNVCDLLILTRLQQPFMRERSFYRSSVAVWDRDRASPAGLLDVTLQQPSPMLHKHHRLERCKYACDMHDVGGYKFVIDS